MTDEAPPTRGLPWATAASWVALALAVAGAVGVVLAVASAVSAVQDPQSFGALGAVALLVYALVPSLLALPVGIVQARRGWSSRGRARTTIVLASLAPVAVWGLLMVNTVRDLTA
ncbi:hypothetical protein [Cellulomonas fengjieae]|uniref:Major facilitator superfamily (MFS) profile domain-containing protein n=1 Tax=Cellulomonas fengjieae TaxID=2819978 RepID=A0ABS3SJS8_9CELL|nr:hypothetical protein [Cellulomonas fengjieae]MBO3085995.1 hypothetical protein [Cellulomonas fengjieae]MBO3103944.1 hypothetical protein [Cellulomonas fengjieae]QVI65935.1 hypothetical protein KG102_17985 [Cellulomonas fengjieae]